MGVGLVVLSAIALYLHETCRLLPLLKALYGGPSFLKFVVALIIVLAILTVLPEPQSTMLSVLVIIGMLLIDSRVNKGASLLNTIAKP